MGKIGTPSFFKNFNLRINKGGLHYVVRESMSNMKNGKAARTFGVLSEMVKAPQKAAFGMITDLVNQILVGVTPTRWELSTIVNCY